MSDSFARDLPTRLNYGAPPPQSMARAKYLRDWNTVRRARFNAAKRFERKNEASTLAFAIAGIVGFLVPVYTLIFRDDISQHVKNVLDFTAYITGAMSLILGLIEQAKEHSAKALRFDTCARQINSVLRRLATTPTVTDQDLQPFIAQYEKALEDCGDNHDQIDHEIARTQSAIDEATSRIDKEEAEKRLTRLKWRECAETYWLYVFIWCTPIIIGVIIGITSAGSNAPVLPPLPR